MNNTEVMENEQPERKPTLFERKLPRRIAGLVIGMMYACGVSFIVATALELAVPRPQIFLTCLITLVIMSVLFYNKITAVVSLLLAAAGVAWFFVFGGGVKWLTEGDGRVFIERIIDLIRTGAGDAESHALAARLICYVACIISYCTACRLAGAITLGVGTLGVFLAVWYVGTKEVFGCFALCASATAAVSAASFGRKRARVVKNGDANYCGSPAALAIFAIPLTVLLAVVCTFFRPLTLAPAFHVRSVERALDDFADVIASRYSGFSRRTTSFSLNAVGYGTAANLGGPVTPTDSLTLIVSTPDEGKIPLLKGSVRANYTGSGWTEGKLSGSYRYTSRLWQAQRDDAFDLTRAVNLADTGFTGSFEHVTVSVYHYSHFSSMFSVDRPDTVFMSSQTPYFNLQGELFPKSPLAEGQGYTMRGWSYKGLTRAARRASTRLTERLQYSERTDYVDKLYDEYLPDGEVDPRVLVRDVTLPKYDPLGDTLDPADIKVSAPMPQEDGLYFSFAADDASTVYSRQRAQSNTTYSLFYGYTADDLERIDKYKKDLAEYERRLAINPNYDGNEPVEPQPRAVWLSGARLASYGLSEEMCGAMTRADTSDHRERTRSTYCVVKVDSDPTSVPMIRLPSVTVVKIDSDPTSVPTVQISGVTDASSSMIHLYLSSTKTVLHGVTGISGVRLENYWTATAAMPSTVDHDALAAGMAALAEDYGFDRLEYAGYAIYSPGATKTTTQVLSGLYYSTLDDMSDANKFELAYTFAKYLSDNFTYTLDPMPVPDGVDFCDWFLSTGEGYCTYYATAMARMARFAGIPSRYAEGYSLANADRNEDNTAYLLTGEDAHAWAELYFDGVGFIPFDALSIERLNDTDKQKPDDVVNEPPVTETPTPTPPTPHDDWLDDPDDLSEPISLWWLWLIVAVAAVAGAVVGSAALYNKLRSLDHLRKKYGNVGAARELWREILVLLPQLDKAAERRPDETSLRYAHRIETLVLIPGAPFDGVAMGGMKAWYAEHKLTEDELRMLDRCAAELRRRGMLRLKFAPRFMRDRSKDVK